MKTTLIEIVKALAIVLLLQPLSGLSQERDDESPEFDDTVEIAVSAVPKNVMAAALKAKPGIYITAAMRELTPNDRLYYILDGSLVKSYWTITVRADGELIHMTEEGEPPKKRD